MTAHADLAGSRVAKIVCQQDRAKNRSARNHIDGGTNRHVYRCFPGSPLRRLASQKNEWAQSVIAQEKPLPNKHGLSVKRTWSPTRASGRRQPPLARHHEQSQEPAHDGRADNVLRSLGRLVQRISERTRYSSPFAGYLFFPADKLWATAARIRSFKADASILSPSLKSMARVFLASRPALNIPFGSFRDAPLKKLSFT